VPVRVGLSGRRARKRPHTSTSVFLHELAHTLGVPHEVDAATVMGPRYGTKIDGFSAPAAQLMRLYLDHELEPRAQTEQAFAKAVLDHLGSRPSARRTARRSSRRAAT
jgi:hypothetical protein